VAALQSGDLPALGWALGNDLEPVTAGFVPEVSTYMRELLQAGALGATMTGTGTAVYGIFGIREDARMMERRLQAPLVKTHTPVARGVEIS
jgi:4-diphosphocytidyl-2-C-methyl-D-erythritol kinase